MPGSLWYDRRGREVPMEIAARLHEDMDYRVVGSTVLRDGKWVSTVLIFETRVFPSEGDYGELACARYATLEEARLGHETMVAQFSGGAAVSEREVEHGTSSLIPIKRRHLASHE